MGHKRVRLLFCCDLKYDCRKNLYWNKKLYLTNLPKARPQLFHPFQQQILIFTWSKIILDFGSIEKSLKSDIGEIIYLVYCIVYSRINKSRQTIHAHMLSNKKAKLFYFINILESHWTKVFVWKMELTEKLQLVETRENGSETTRQSNDGKVLFLTLLFYLLKKWFENCVKRLSVHVFQNFSRE